MKGNNWYDKDYKTKGFTAQRLYPNEELLRFMGRNFFGLDLKKRNKIKILETGCGSCSNLWMIAKEGFKAYGIDFSPAAIDLGKQMLKKWGVKAEIKWGDMRCIEYPDGYFDVVIDIFSSNCLTFKDYEKYVAEVSRVLKPNGLFFTYTPSVESLAYIKHYPAKKIDKFTLNGIYRKNSPFFGHFYNFRFDDLKTLKKLFKKYHLSIRYNEKITRSYRNMKENFQHLSIESIKKIQ